MIKAKVLFLCTKNSSRTQMAEGFLNSLAGDRFDVVSAGAEPGEVSPAAIDAMREVGIDIRAHSPKDVSLFIGSRFTFVVHLCEREKERECPIFPGAIYRLTWDIESPRESTSDFENATRIVRDKIRRHVEEFVEQHA